MNPTFLARHPWIDFILAVGQALVRRRWCDCGCDDTVTNVR